LSADAVADVKLSGPGAAGVVKVNVFYLQMSFIYKCIQINSTNFRLKIVADMASREPSHHLTVSSSLEPHGQVQLALLLPLMLRHPNVVEGKV
jgi:hypothetical protein